MVHIDASHTTDGMQHLPHHWQRFMEFDLVNSTVQTIWKNRTNIGNAFESNGSKINIGSVQR